MKLTTVFLLICSFYGSAQKLPDVLNHSTEKLFGKVSRVKETVFIPDSTQPDGLVELNDSLSRSGRVLVPVQNRFLTFDRKGRLTKLNVGNMDERAYKYDRKGRLKVQRNEVSDHGLVWEEAYSYDEAGRIISSETTINDRPVSRRTYTYDCYNRVVTSADSSYFDQEDHYDYSTCAGPDSCLIVREALLLRRSDAIRSEYTLDTLGQVIYDARTGYTLIYDLSGNRIEERSGYGSITRIEYDCSGHVEWEYLPDEFHNYVLARYERTWDEEGNWTSERYYSGRELQYVVKRDITYGKFFRPKIKTGRPGIAHIFRK